MLLLSIGIRDSPRGLRWRALDRLGKSGFDVELLASRHSNLKVLRKLDRAKIEEVKGIVMREFIAEKFKNPSLEPEIMKGDLDSMARALQGVRLNAVYLVWKNHRYTKYPDPSLGQRI